MNDVERTMRDLVRQANRKNADAAPAFIILEGYCFNNDGTILGVESLDRMYELSSKETKIALDVFHRWFGKSFT